MFRALIRFLGPLAFNVILVFAVALLALLFTVSIQIVKVRAHDDGEMHYPQECCHDLDCAPVTRVDHVAASYKDANGIERTEPLPVMVVTTAHGMAMVPGSFPLRRSQDGRMHACINSRVSPPKLICLFMPDGQ